jgi:hypothetical protein
MSSGSSRCTDDLARHLGQRRHRRDDVDDLEARLLAAQDAFLAGEHHHRHGAEQRIGGAGGEIERARAKRRQAHAGRAGQPAVSRRHEGGRLLVPGQHQLDLRAPQRLDDVEVLFARHAEDAANAFVLQRGDQKFGALHRVPPSVLQNR